MPPAKKAPAKRAAAAKKAGPAAKKAGAPAKKAPPKKAPPKKVAAKAAPAKRKTAAVAVVKKKAPVKAAPTAKKAPPKKAPPKKAPVKAPPKPAARRPVPAPARKPIVLKRRGKVVLDKFEEAQKKVLLEERDRLTRQSASLKAEADSLASDRELGDTQFDDESGEGDTLAVERDRDLVLSAQFSQQVTEINHALAKFEDGTYGICEVSGKPIPKERLKAIPWARERVEYKVGVLFR